jgi:hypothetical protein
MPVMTTARQPRTLSMTSTWVAPHLSPLFSDVVIQIHASHFIADGYVHNIVDPLAQPSTAFAEALPETGSIACECNLPGVRITCRLLAAWISPGGAISYFSIG